MVLQLDGSSVRGAGLLDITGFGCDPTGSTGIIGNNTLARAIQASLVHPVGADAAGIPTFNGIYIPAGVYKLDQYFDWNTVFAGAYLTGWTMYAEAGAVFYGHGMKFWFGDNGAQLIAGRVRFPAMASIGTAGAAEDGLTLGRIVDSEIWVPRIADSPTKGYRDALVVDESGPSTGNVPGQGFFNNEMHVGYITGSTRWGIRISGTMNPNGYDAQANRYYVCQVRGSGADGIANNPEGAGYNSQWNIWDIGVLENNGGVGFYDVNGATILRVANTNANSGNKGANYANGSMGVAAQSGYFLHPSAQNLPQIQGCFSDGYTFNNVSKKNAAGVTKYPFIVDEVSLAGYPTALPS